MEQDSCYTLTSSTSDSGLIRKHFNPPLFLDRRKKVFVSVIGLSCPPARQKSPNIIKVFCSINGEKEKICLIRAVAEKNKKFYHSWKSLSAAPVCVPSFLLRSIALRIDPRREQDGHPSVALVKVRSCKMSRKNEDEQEERHFFTSSKAFDKDASAHEFRVPLPEYLRDRRRCFSVSLNSITLNPFFRIFPYVVGSSEPVYNISWTSDGGVEETKTMTYTDLFEDRRTLKNWSESFFLAYSLITNLFIKERANPPCEITSLNELDKTNGKSENALQKLHVTWLSKGTISVPKMIAYFLSWGEIDMSRDKFGNVTRHVSEGDESIFLLHPKKMAAWFPRNLQLEVDFISPNEEGSILKTIPIKRYAFNEQDYKTFTPSLAEKREFRYPCQEYLTFRLKTLEGSLAAFEAKKSELFLDCVFEEKNKNKGGSYFI